MPGIVGRAVDAVRAFFRRERDNRSKAASVARGRDSLRPHDPYAFVGMNTMAEYLTLDRDLVSRYQDYSEMESYPILGTALDIYADDATQPEALTGKTIWAQSDNDEVAKMLDDLLQNRLRVEDEAWEITRTLCKYGNVFEENLVLQDQGVVGLNHLPPESVRRYEKDKGELIGFVQDPTGAFKMSGEDVEKAVAAGKAPHREVAVFEDWQVTHWRMRAKNRRSAYGHGVFEPARAAWRRLLLMEDAVLIYRITRSPARYAFYVDVGDLPPKAALKHLRRIRDEYKRQRFVDPTTGKLDERFNVLCLALDTEIPLLDGRTLSLNQIIAEHKQGKRHWTYSMDLATKKIVPGEVLWAGVTRKNAEVVEVELDNGKKIRATPDHKFIRRSGEAAEAKDLKPGDSLMPLPDQARNKLRTKRPTTKTAYLTEHNIVPVGNHKVVAVRCLTEREDTGCINVKRWHNFALESGNLVNNSLDEDFFFPTRGGTEAVKADVLSGPTYQAMEDVDYFLGKIFAAIKIPRAYLTFEEDLGGKGTLVHEDIRFARTVLRIQREVRNGYKRVGRTHLIAKGIDPATVDWELFMTVPSAAYEAAQMEVRKMRAELADAYSKYASERWVMREVLGWTDEQIDLIRREKALEELGEGLPGGAGAGGERKKQRESLDANKVRKLTEQMDAGDRRDEIRLGEKMDKLMKSHDNLAKRIQLLRGFGHELRLATFGMNGNGHHA